MKIKVILLVMNLLFVLSINAQKEYAHKGIYTTIGYEFGFLSSELQKTALPFTDSSLGNNFNHSVSITGIYKTPLKAEIKIGYTGSYTTLNIEGNNDGRLFEIKNNYFVHTTFLGAGYNIPIMKDIDVTIGLGSSVSFVKDKITEKATGEEADQIVASNVSVKKGNVYIIPELSISKYFKNGSILTLGGKYYHSANDSFIEGVVQNLKNGLLEKQVNFSTQNNQIALYISYGFNISKLFF